MSILLAAMMVMSMTACSSENEEGSSTADASNTESSAAESSKAESSKAESSKAESSEEDVVLSGTVTLGGSTSVEKVVGAFMEAFMEENENVSVTYDPTGSGAGITGASEGTLDIGLSSRNLKEEETGLEATVFALDGIAIIVNNENTVTDLTMEQIKQLATGEVTNWNEVGGPDMPVVLVGREAGSGTRDGFESIVDVEDVCAYDQELTSTGAVIAAVASNPNAFGYASLASVDETVKAVTVDGIAATEESVQDGTYAIQRPFVFVTKEGAELSDEAQAFIDFALSEEAEQLIIGAGCVPVK